MLHKDLNTFEGIANVAVENAISTFNTDEYVDFSAITNKNDSSKDNTDEFFWRICTQWYIVRLFNRDEMVLLKMK